MSHSLGIILVTVIYIQVYLHHTLGNADMNNKHSYDLCPQYLLKISILIISGYFLSCRSLRHTSMSSKLLSYP